MTHTADAHTLTLSHTNSGGWVAVCLCGWQSAVHQLGRTAPGDRVSRAWADSAAKGGAALDHQRHMADERERARGMSDDDAIRIVRRTGRFTYV